MSASYNKVRFKKAIITRDRVRNQFRVVFDDNDVVFADTIQIRVKTDLTPVRMGISPVRMGISLDAIALDPLPEYTYYWIQQTSYAGEKILTIE